MENLNFRAWNTKTGKMEYLVELTSYRDGGLGIAIPTGADSDDLVVMPYTGRKDKKGIEIFEGDILESVWGGSVGKVTGAVEYNPDRAGFEVWGSLHSCGMRGRIFPSLERQVYVIGNIYENPELLKGE